MYKSIIPRLYNKLPAAIDVLHKVQEFFFNHRTHVHSDFTGWSLYFQSNSLIK